MAWTKEKMAETVKALLVKANKDESFRTKLIANPKEVIVDETGIEIPEDYNIKAVDMNETDLLIRLPKQKGALKDSELEEVAGGKSSFKQDLREAGHIVADGLKDAGDIIEDDPEILFM